MASLTWFFAVSRYCLASPTAFSHVWLNAISPMTVVCPWLAKEKSGSLYDSVPWTGMSQEPEERISLMISYSG